MQIRKIVSGLWFPVLLLVLIAYLGWKMKDMPSERDLTRYANDPVMLYQTAGIKECGSDYRHKVEKTRAVLIDASDLAVVVPLIIDGHFKGRVDTILYTNAPEAKDGLRGQPAIIPLRKENGAYCALGIAGSYSTQIFLELERKYQRLLK